MKQRLMAPGALAAFLLLAVSCAPPAADAAGRAATANKSSTAGGETAAGLQAADQSPGRRLAVADVRSPHGAWVVAHANDANGRILGQRRFDYRNVALRLSKATKPGETIVLTLNADRSLGRFDQTADPPLTASGQPIMALVTVR